MLRPLQSFLDAVVERVAAIRACSLRCVIRRSRRRGRRRDLGLTVRGEAFVNSLFAVRELAAARIAGRFSRRPVVGTNERSGLVAADHRLIGIEAASAYYGRRDRRQDKHFAAAPTALMVVFEVFFVSEEIL